MKPRARSERSGPSGRPILIVAANVLTIFAALITAPILARVLGPSGRGDVAAAVAALNILPIILGLGLPLVVRRLSATDQAQAAIRSARLLTLLLFLPSGLIAVAVTPVLFAGLSGPERLFTMIGLALAPVTVLWMVDASAMVGHENYRAVFLIRTAQPIAFMLFTILASLGHFLSVETAILAQSISNLAPVLLGAVSSRTSLFGEMVSLVAMVREGVSVAGGSIAEAVNYRLDQVLLLPLAGSAQAGLYSVAAMIGSIPPALAQALAAPSYREIVAKSDIAARRTSVLRGSREIVSVSAVVVSALMVFTYPVTGLLFGEDFLPSVPVTLVYLVASFALCSASFFSITLAGIQRGRVMTVGQIGAAVINIGVLVAITPYLGAMGAAIASAITYLGLAVFLVRYLHVGPTALIPSLTHFRGGLRTLFGGGRR